MTWTSPQSKNAAKQPTHAEVPASKYCSGTRSGIDLTMQQNDDCRRRRMLKKESIGADHPEIAVSILDHHSPRAAKGNHLGVDADEGSRTALDQSTSENIIVASYMDFFEIFFGSSSNIKISPLQRTAHP
jgi:hypothetical protein